MAKGTELLQPVPELKASDPEAQSLSTVSRVPSKPGQMCLQHSVGGSEFKTFHPWRVCELRIKAGS